MATNKFGFKPLTKELEKENLDTVQGKITGIKKIKAPKYYDNRGNEIKKSEAFDLRQDGEKIGRKMVEVGQVAKLVVFNENNERVFINLNTSFGIVNYSKEKEQQIVDGDFVEIKGIIKDTYMTKIDNKTGEKITLTFRTGENKGEPIQQYTMVGITEINKVA